MTKTEIFNSLDQIADTNNKVMNLLDYINELIENGYSEEDAERCADFLYSDEWESDEDDTYYSPSNPWDAPGMRISDFI